MSEIRPLWRRTPPAVFFVCLGFMGLGLGWRNAADVLPVPHEIGDLLLGLSSAYFVYFLAFYLRKLVARPSVLLDDMSSAPARAAIAAAAMSMMLLAAALLPFGISVPEVWWTGVILQIGASAFGCYSIWRDPPEMRHFTPYQFLTFVGPVVGPIAGIPLGYVTESILLTLAALVPFVVIVIGYVRQSRTSPPPVRMRPTVAIFLAPNCLFAISFGLLEIEWAFLVFYISSSAVAIFLLLRIPWLVKGGWSPVWASFTFPSAAILQVQVMAVGYGFGIGAVIAVYAAMALATPVILIISYRYVLMWVTGELAEKTGAARA